MNTLCTAPEVPLKMRKLVFERVVFACKKELYSYYHAELLDILCNPSLDKELQQLAAVELKSMVPGNEHPANVLDTLHDLLVEMDKEEELKQLKRDHPLHFREK